MPKKKICKCMNTRRYIDGICSQCGGIEPKEMPKKKIRDLLEELVIELADQYTYHFEKDYLNKLLDNALSSLRKLMLEAVGEDRDYCECSLTMQERGICDVCKNCGLQISNDYPSYNQAKAEIRERVEEVFR
jgi:threonine synthase